MQKDTGDLDVFFRFWDLLECWWNWLQLSISSTLELSISSTFYEQIHWTKALKATFLHSHTCEQRLPLGPRIFGRCWQVGALCSEAALCYNACKKWNLLNGGCCVQVVVNSGLTLLKFCGERKFKKKFVLKMLLICIVSRCQFH